MDKDKKHSDPTPEKAPSDSSTVFFPPIAQTTEEENAAIHELLTKPQAPPTEAEEELYYTEQLEEEPSAPVEQSPAEPTDEKAQKPMPKIPHLLGLFPACKARFQSKKGHHTPLTLLLFSLLFLALSLCVILTFCLYAATVACLFVLDFFFALLGVLLLAVALGATAFAVLSAISSGVLILLVELGLALVFVSLILALCALIYELSTARLPSLIRLSSRYYLFLNVLLLTWFLGSERKRSRDKEAAR